MPRRYEKVSGPSRRQKYGAEQLEAALKDAKSGKSSLRSAARKYSVPFSTLQEHSSKGTRRPYGGQTVLSTGEEATLAKCVAICADWGFPLQKSDLKVLVHEFLARRKRSINVFRHDTPGDDWVLGFLRRHQNLVHRFAQNVSRRRASVSEESILAYFRNLEESLEGVHPANIVNYDETGFSDDPGRSKAISRRGARTAERVIDHSKCHTSVMFAISASGVVLPPYILYKAKYLYESWEEGGPPRALYDSDESGWFTMKTFESWFIRVAVPYFRKLDGKKVLIGDNLSSHVSQYVIEACQDLEIRFVLLPSNSTHLCQPLDVSWFRPLKRAWKAVLQRHNVKRRGNLSKAEFPGLLKGALETIGERLRTNAIAAFKRTPKKFQRSFQGQIWRRKQLLMIGPKS